MKGWIFLLSFFGIIGAYIQFELPAQVVAILWLATKQSSQVASNGKIDEELVHKVEQLQNFLFRKLPRWIFSSQVQFLFFANQKSAFYRGAEEDPGSTPLFMHFSYSCSALLPCPLKRLLGGNGATPISCHSCKSTSIKDALLQVSKKAQCLKITEKVSFNTYILHGKSSLFWMHQ